MPSLRPYASCAANTSAHSPLVFQSLDSNLAEKIWNIISTCRTRSCDQTAGGILMWIDYYNYSFATIGNTLFIKGVAEDGSGRTAFSLPMGEMPMADALQLVLDYCADNGIAPLFSAIPESALDSFIAKGCGEITELTDLADYIYDADSLATLTGKAYNKKRNHVNRFVNDNPEWTLTDLNVTNGHAAAEFVERLGLQSDKADPKLAAYEWAQNILMLQNLGKYKYIGGVLTTDGHSIAAVTLGEIIGDTLILHIEKADHNVAGAGEAINKFFAEKILNEHPGIRYINREDCAGDPGLRFAKESYHPTMLLRKYNVAF